MSQNNFQDYFESIGKSLNSASNNIQEEIQQSTVSSVQSVQNFFSSYSNSSILIGLIILVILALFVSYGLYWLVADKLFNNTVDVVLSSNVPLSGTSKTNTIANITPTGNGFRRSYTFWIYLNDMNINSGQYKHVLHLVNNVDGKINNACPYIFLDKTENKLNIRFAKKTDDNITTCTLQNLSTLNTFDIHNFMNQGIRIDYIPLQRWVHIGIVVNQTSSNTTITSYVDGDVSKIRSTGDANDVIALTTDTTSSAVTSTFIARTVGDFSKVDYENLNLNVTGNLTVGGDISANGFGFSGLLSKFKTFNYDINQKDIYNDYNEGPVNSLLLNLGLSNYGIRSPIYQIT